jgi:hypothetical protein
VRLITRLENQSELYQMADLGGLNVEGLGGTGGSEIVCDDPLETVVVKISVIVAR